MDKLIKTLEDQIKFGPSENAMYRLLDMAKQIQADKQ